MDVIALNKEQLKAVKYKTGPLLVIAGAGTGKTQVITQRIRYLLDELRVPDFKIVALTFTEKAAEEMETRVSQLCRRYIFDVSINTYNAFGYKLLQRFAHDIGLQPNFKVLTFTQQIILLKEHFDELKLDYYAPITRPDAFLGALVKYFSQLKNNQLTPTIYEQYVKKQFNDVDNKAAKLEKTRQQELLNAFKTYLDITKRVNAIDMDDQIYLVVELFKSRPNVLQKVQSEIDYILVDEYQDTNYSQGQLLDLLAADKQNIMVVGDDDQCIYNFRGAAINNILAFKDRHQAADQLILTENYRSSQKILDSAYRLIQNNNPNRLEAKYKLDKHLKGQFIGKEPRLVTFIAQEEEAAWLASDIKKRITNGQDPNQIAILLRKNQQAEVLKRYLDMAEIPYAVLGEVTDLYKQPVVRLLINILKIILDPQDSESLYHVLASELFNLDQNVLRDIVSQSKRQHIALEKCIKQLNFGDIEGFSNDDKKALDTLIEQLNDWRNKLSKISVGKLAYQIMEDKGFLSTLLEKAKDDPSVDLAISMLNKYFMTLLNYERIATDITAIGYMNSLSALEESGQYISLDEGEELLAPKVHVLTIHKAKGLEFETVYVFDLTDGVFPARKMYEPLELPVELLGLSQAVGRDSFIEEERRLMYVAMTRAKKELILTYSADHGGARPKKPSVFIEEALGLRPELGKYQGLARSTNQITLFKDRVNIGSVHQIPSSILQGDKVILNTRQIEDYLMCPAEFRFRHIISPPLPVNFAMEYGTLLHSVIQYYNRQKMMGTNIKLAELVNYLKTNWPKEGFISNGHSERGLVQAKRTIERYYKREQLNKASPLYVEKPFSVELGDINTVINGRFDAIFSCRDGVEIRDYKTGASAVTSQDKANQRAKESLQMGLYALAWGILGGKLPCELVLDFIDSGLVGKTVKTARQLDSVKKRVKAVADGIRANDFEPHGSHIFCTHQEYGL